MSDIQTADPSSMPIPVAAAPIINDVSAPPPKSAEKPLDSAQEPAKAQPKEAVTRAQKQPHDSSVTAAIVATTVIVLVMGVLVVFAYLKSK